MTMIVTRWFHSYLTGKQFSSEIHEDTVKSMKTLPPQCVTTSFLFDFNRISRHLGLALHFAYYRREYPMCLNSVANPCNLLIVLISKGISSTRESIAPHRCHLRSWILLGAVEIWNLKLLSGTHCRMRDVSSSCTHDCALEAGHLMDISIQNFKKKGKTEQNSTKWNRAYRVELNWIIMQQTLP